MKQTQNQKTIKQITSQIWTINGDKVFSGKDTMIIIDQKTGKVEEYEKVSEYKKDEFIINAEGEQEVSPEEMYGENGFKRARWVEAKIIEQTKENEN